MMGGSWAHEGPRPLRIISQILVVVQTTCSSEQWLHVASLYTIEYPMIPLRSTELLHCILAPGLALGGCLRVSSKFCTCGVQKGGSLARFWQSEVLCCDCHEPKDELDD